MSAPPREATVDAMGDAPLHPRRERIGVHVQLKMLLVIKEEVFARCLLSSAGCSKVGVRTCPSRY
jgi:hypothetical protein